MDIKEELKYTIYATKLRHAKLRAAHAKLTNIPLKRYRDLIKEYRDTFCPDCKMTITDQMVSEFATVLDQEDIPAVLIYLEGRCHSSTELNHS